MLTEEKACPLKLSISSSDSCPRGTIGNDPANPLFGISSFVTRRRIEAFFSLLLLPLLSSSSLTSSSMLSLSALGRARSGRGSVVTPNQLAGLWKSTRGSVRALVGKSLTSVSKKLLGW